MFGFGKKSKLKYLAKKYKEIQDYLSYESSIMDSNRDSIQRRADENLSQLMREFSISPDINIFNQKKELKEFFMFLKPLDRFFTPVRGDIRSVSYSFFYASRLSMYFKNNNKKDCDSVLGEIVPEYAEIL